MFSMTIMFGESPVPWTLLFKSADSFDLAKTNYLSAESFNMQGQPNGDFQCTDDFGQHVLIKRADIHGVMFEDLSLSKLAHIERALHQTRLNIEAQNMGKADPQISAAMRANAGSPGVLTPFGANGAFPRQ